MNQKTSLWSLSGPLAIYSILIIMLLLIIQLSRFQPNNIYNLRQGLIQLFMVQKSDFYNFVKAADRGHDLIFFKDITSKDSFYFWFNAVCNGLFLNGDNSDNSFPPYPNQE